MVLIPALSTKTNVAAGTYRIEEILPSGLPDYRVDSTFNGEEATKGTVTVQDQKTAIAKIVNTYVYDIVSPPTGVQNNAIPLAAVFAILPGSRRSISDFFQAEKIVALKRMRINEPA